MTYCALVRYTIKEWCILGQGHTVEAVQVKVAQAGNRAAKSGIDLRASELLGVGEGEGALAKVHVHLTHLPQLPI